MSNLSTPVKVFGVLTTILLLIVVNPWYQIPDDQAQLRDLVTYGFWISFIVLLVLLFMERNKPGGDTVEIEGPAFTRFLFSNSKAGLFWLPVRLFLGFSWLEAGWHKLTGEGWMDGGAALAGYWANAVKIPEAGQGRPPITYEWYRGFIQLLVDNGAESWFAPLIVFGEIAVGLGLIFGVLTGFAAFFGALMNMSFLLAGSASTNPVLFTLAIGLILAWKVAGYYGVDRWLLPMLGTPWHPAVLSGKATSTPGSTTG
jgi:thiosulfate dehydrogenase [quinone] large subunit